MKYNHILLFIKLQLNCLLEGSLWLYSIMINRAALIRHVTQRLPLIRVIAFIVVSIGLFPCVAFSDTSGGIIKPEVGEINGRKAIRFHVSGSFIWCGPGYLALSHGENAGIRLLNITNGNTDQLTTVKSHHPVACTPDGKYVFFVDTVNKGRLEVIDVINRKQDIIFSKKEFSHPFIDEQLMSPSGMYLLGPATLKMQIELSDRIIQGLPIPPNMLKYELRNGGLAWAGDKKAYILFGEFPLLQKLMVLHARTKNMAELINLPKVENYRFMGRIRYAEKSDKLYLLAWPESEDGVPMLYMLDPDKPDKSMQLVDSNVDEFNVLHNGSVVYVKTIGVNYSHADFSVFSKSSKKTLFSRSVEGVTAELLSVPYATSGISDIQVSSGGNEISFREGGAGSAPVITILYFVK